jgi:hypothetical protein
MELWSMHEHGEDDVMSPPMSPELLNPRHVEDIPREAATEGPDVAVRIPGKNGFSASHPQVVHGRRPPARMAAA